MSNPAEIPNPALSAPLPDLTRLTGAIGSVPRWLMLKELSGGEPRTVTELATAAGCSYQSSTRFRNIICPRPARPSWILAIACSGWTKRGEDFLNIKAKAPLGKNGSYSCSHWCL